MVPLRVFSVMIITVLASMAVLAIVPAPAVRTTVPARALVPDLMESVRPATGRLKLPVDVILRRFVDVDPVALLKKLNAVE